jgi:hypothetical protein
MKRFLCLAAAVTAVATFGISQANADDGFGCGSCGGWNSYYGYNFNNSGFERPPYFALYPPVYYSDQIVRRPMGISPFAAPPGVIPAEMTVFPMAEKVVNPYFQNGESKKAKPISGQTDNNT